MPRDERGHGEDDTGNEKDAHAIKKPIHISGKIDIEIYGSTQDTDLIRRKFAKGLLELVAKLEGDGRVINSTVFRVARWKPEKIPL